MLLEKLTNAPMPPVPSRVFVARAGVHAEATTAIRAGERILINALSATSGQGHPWSVQFAIWYGEEPRSLMSPRIVDNIRAVDAPNGGRVFLLTIPEDAEPGATLRIRFGSTEGDGSKNAAQLCLQINVLGRCFRL